MSTMEIIIYSSVVIVIAAAVSLFGWLCGRKFHYFLVPIISIIGIGCFIAGTSELHKTVAGFAPIVLGWVFVSFLWLDELNI